MRSTLRGDSRMNTSRDSRNVVLPLQLHIDDVKIHKCATAKPKPLRGRTCKSPVCIFGPLCSPTIIDRKFRLSFRSQLEKFRIASLDLHNIQVAYLMTLSKGSIVI